MKNELITQTKIDNLTILSISQLSWLLQRKPKEESNALTSQNGNTKEAIAVFKINVAEFSNSWNTYDSLGEAYMMHRQMEKAMRTMKNPFR